MKNKIGFWMAMLLVFSLVLGACASGEEGNEQNQGTSPALENETEVPGSLLATDTPPVLGAPVDTSTPEALATTTASLPETGATATSALPNLATEPAVTALAPLTSTLPVTGTTGMNGEAKSALLSKLLDFHVKDTSGNDLGEVEDMVIDLGQQQVNFVVLSSGGFLGIGEKLIPIPWNALKVQANTADDSQNGFIVSVNKDVLTQAPNFDKSQLPDVNSPDWDTNFNTFWEPYYNTPMTGTETTPMTGTNTLSNTTSLSGTTAAGLTGKIMAEKLLGYDVKSTNGDGLGEIEDAVIALQTGKVEYALLSAGGFLGLGEKVIPLPLNAFSMGKEGEELVVNATEDSLKQAPNFDKNNLPDFNLPDWDQQIRLFWQDQVH